VIADPNVVAEFAAKQDRHGNIQNFPSEIPESHFDAAGHTHEHVCRAIGAAAGEWTYTNAQIGIDHVDLQRFLPTRKGAIASTCSLTPTAGVPYASPMP